MINRMIPFGSLAAAIVGVLAVLAIAGAFDSDEPGPAGEKAAALCVEGAEDCDDTVALPVGDGDPVLAILHNDGVVDEGESLAIDAAFAELVVMEPSLSGIVTVILVEATDWPNACLGVETLGIACAQVITSGYIVTLVTGVAGWVFHTDANGHAVFADAVGVEYY